MDITAKLKLKGDTLYLLKAPEQCIVYFGACTVKTRAQGSKPLEQVVLFVESVAELNESIQKYADRLADDAVFWVAYPKKSGSIRTDISRDKGWDVLQAKGYIPVTQVAVDADWSALRFRKEEQVGAKLRDIPMTERNVEGVDFVNRTVTLPADVLKALQPHKDLKRVFDKMSFSHKKEYVQSIVEAKKPETRQRRIEKMLTMLEQTKAKEEKK